MEPLIHPYLADDVNKVFAKVSRKISRVKIERLLTRARLLKKKSSKIITYSSNNDSAGLPKYHHNNTGVTP